jgi:hypothetical protein
MCLHKIGPAEDEDELQDLPWLALTAGEKWILPIPPSPHVCRGKDFSLAPFADLPGGGDNMKFCKYIPTDKPVGEDSFSLLPSYS